MKSRKQIDRVFDQKPARVRRAPRVRRVRHKDWAQQIAKRIAAPPSKKDSYNVWIPFGD